MTDPEEWPSVPESANLCGANVNYFETMYQDRIDRISETKKFLNELARWTVTINLASLAFCVSLDLESRSLWLATIPIFIMTVSFVLFRSLVEDCKRHRLAISKLRKLAGGIAWQLHSKGAKDYAGGKWRPEFEDTYSVIIIASSLFTAFLMIIAELYCWSYAGV